MRGFAIGAVILTIGHCDELTVSFTSISAHQPGFLHRPLIPSNDGIHILVSISDGWAQAIMREREGTEKMHLARRRKSFVTISRYGGSVSND